MAAALARRLISQRAEENVACGERAAPPGNERSKATMSAPDGATPPDSGRPAAGAGTPATPDAAATAAGFGAVPSAKPASPGTPAPRGSGEEDRHVIAAHEAAAAQAAPRLLSHAEIRTIFFGVMLATFLAALNQTIVATALPTIGRHFDDFENLSWIVTAYLLTSTAVAPLYGKLSDIYGRRAMMLTAIGLFLAGSVPVHRRAQHDDADPGPRAAGHRRRRHPAAGPGGDRRRRRAARARPVPGLYGRRLGDIRRRRAGAGRRAGGAFPLDRGVRTQHPAGAVRGLPVLAQPGAHPAQRAQAPARHPGRGADDGLGGAGAAGADLGRHALLPGCLCRSWRCSRRA